MCGLSGFRLQKGKETEIRVLLGQESVTWLIEKGRLKSFGHCKHEDYADWVKCGMRMETEGTRQRGNLRKSWCDCVKEDMKCLGLSQGCTSYKYMMENLSGCKLNQIHLGKWSCNDVRVCVGMLPNSSLQLEADDFAKLKLQGPGQPT